jgi:TPR repeat protein
MKQAVMAVMAALALTVAADVAADPAAALREGLAWRNGIGRAIDPVAARRCFRDAAQGGEPAAMFLLAHMLADGEGGAPDVAAARAWLEQAAEREYPEALQELALAEGDPQRADALMRAAAHALAHRAHAARQADQD